VIKSSDRSAVDQFEEAADAVITFASSDAVTEQALRVVKGGGTLAIGARCLGRFPMEKATDLLELLAAGKLRSRAVLEKFALNSAADPAAEGGILWPCFSARSSAARSEPRETS
jgi:D-arabinose 1-dehydrogenase-like Zn-dependent alcohol dehydrogenase